MPNGLMAFHIVLSLCELLSISWVRSDASSFDADADDVIPLKGVG